MKIDYSQYLLDGIKKNYISPIVCKEFDYLTSHFKDFADYLNSTFDTNTFHFHFENYYTYDKSKDAYYYQWNIHLTEKDLVIVVFNSNLLLSKESIDNFVCKTFKIKVKPTTSLTPGSLYVISGNCNSLFDSDAMEPSLIRYLQAKYPDKLSKLVMFL